MSNELVERDPRALAVRAEIQKRWNDRTAILKLDPSHGALVAPTMFLAGRGGGGGRSTLGLELEFLTDTEALIIEVGGNRCPAFRNRSADRYMHFPSRDPDRVERALDARMNAPSKVAIIEFEPALYKATIGIAEDFQALLGRSNLMLFYVAGRHEAAPAYGAKAAQRGLGEVFMCREAMQRPPRGENGFLQLPWLPYDIVNAMHADGATLADALGSRAGLWTQQVTRLNLQRFAEAILQRAGQ